MDKRKIKIGILGSGGYGRTARQYLNNTNRYEIVACMDTCRETADTAAEEEHARSYTDLPAFLNDPDMEAVSINTPVLYHAEHIEQCLNTGKHVFVTKPVTAWLEEAERLESLARQKNLAFTVGHHGRHNEVARLVTEVVRSGKLGRLCNVFVTSCSGSSLVQKADDWRVAEGKNPGGPLLQCGIHKIDFLLGLLGPVERICSMMQDDVTEFEPVDNTMTLMQFQNGVQATFVCNYATAYLHTMHFMGTEANLHVHQHITGYGQWEAYLQYRARGVHEPWEALPHPGNDSYPDDHLGILETTFAEQIRTHQPDYTNLGDSIQALRVIHAALESHRTGQVVLCDGVSQNA